MSAHQCTMREATHSSGARRDRVPEGHARRGSLCSLYVRGQKQQYNYRLCRPCGGAMGHLFGT